MTEQYIPPRCLLWLVGYTWVCVHLSEYIVCVFVHDCKPGKDSSNLKDELESVLAVCKMSPEDLESQ